MRQVAGHKEQTLQQKPERQSEGGGRRAKDQKQGRAEDEMNLRHADGEMRQHLEEEKHQRRGCGRAYAEGACALLTDRLGRKFHGIAAGGRGRGIAQDDLGAVNDTGFDMHGSCPSRLKFYTAINRSPPAPRRG